MSRISSCNSALWIRARDTRIARFRKIGFPKSVRGNTHRFVIYFPFAKDPAKNATRLSKSQSNSVALNPVANNKNAEVYLGVFVMCGRDRILTGDLLRDREAC